MDVTHHVLCYIKTSVGQGLLFTVDNSLHLKGFSHSDWATCIDTRWSVIGFYVFLGDSLISWKSKKRHTISWTFWVKSIVPWLLLVVKLFEWFSCLSQSACYAILWWRWWPSYSLYSVFHERTKHIEIDCHFVHDKLPEGVLETYYVPTHHQLAGTLTQPLDVANFERLISKMGILNMYAPSWGGCITIIKLVMYVFSVICYSAVLFVTLLTVLICLVS